MDQIKDKMMAIPEENFSDSLEKCKGYWNRSVKFQKEYN